MADPANADTVPDAPEPASPGATVRLCRRSDLEPGSVRRFDVAGLRIALARIGDELFAVGDRCSHEDFPMSDGEVWAEECELECAKHGSTFDLRTGAPCSLPATTPVPVYQLVVDGDDVPVVVP